MRNAEVLKRAKEKRNIVQRVKGRNANSIGHILRRNCFVKHVIGGKVGGRIEVTGRRGRRCRQLLNNLEETRGYWKLEHEALDRTVWRTGCRRGCGPGVRQTNE